MVRARKSGDDYRLKEDHYYWLAFSCLKGIGPKRFSLLVSFFGSAQKAWQATQNDWRQLKLGQKVIDEWQTFKKDFSPEGFAKGLAVKNYRPLFLETQAYPAVLKTISDPPFVLYVWGEYQSQDEKAIGVVGTRKMTAYGGQVAEALATDLSLSGVTVVSGLARGIDGVAHKATLKAGGRTIAVLGSGFDRVYPAEHRGLAASISRSGVVFSEYPPETPPHPAQFPARNRLISGLSRGVVVVEGAITSGSLITARLAIEQGREVFAVSGPIFHPGSRGPAHLVQSGAKLVLGAGDILNEFGWDQTTGEDGFEGSLSAEEEKVFGLLAQGPVHLNELCRQTGWPVGQLTGLLTMMELKKIVINIGNMSYRQNL